MFGEMASMLGERERTARAVAVNNVIVDVIDSKTMQRKLSDSDLALRAAQVLLLGHLVPGMPILAQLEAPVAPIEGEVPLLCAALEAGHDLPEASNSG